MFLKEIFIAFVFNLENTPGTAGGPGGRDRTLAVAKNHAKMTFFSGGKKNYPKKIFFFWIYLLVMPNIGGNIFSALGVSSKWVKSKRQRERERKKD